jgi:hypothetical protein
MGFAWGLAYGVVCERNVDGLQIEVEMSSSATSDVLYAYGCRTRTYIINPFEIKLKPLLSDGLPREKSV